MAPGWHSRAGVPRRGHPIPPRPVCHCLTRHASAAGSARARTIQCFNSGRREGRGGTDGRGRRAAVSCKRWLGYAHPEAQRTGPRLRCARTLQWPRSLVRTKKRSERSGGGVAPLDPIG